MRWTRCARWPRWPVTTAGRATCPSTCWSRWYAGRCRSQRSTSTPGRGGGSLPLPRSTRRAWSWMAPTRRRSGWPGRYGPTTASTPRSWCGGCRGGSRRSHSVGGCDPTRSPSPRWPSGLPRRARSLPGSGSAWLRVRSCCSSRWSWTAWTARWRATPRAFSSLGAWLDASTDRVKEYACYAGLAYGAGGGDVWLLAAVMLTLQTTRHTSDYTFTLVKNLRESSLRVGGSRPRR